MTEPQHEHDEIEAELARMRPRAMSAELIEAIESRISRRDARPIAKRSWSDRILLFSMTSGAAAACVIVGILVMESSRSTPAANSIGVLAQHQSTADDYPLAFARAELARWEK